MALVTLSSDVHVDATTGASSNRIPRFPDWVAGEALLAAAPCYLNSTDNKIYLSNATAVDEEAEVIGFTGMAYASGDAVTLYPPGVVFYYGDDLSGDDSVSPGDVLYLGATNGRLDTAATVGDEIGIALALDNTHILFTRLHTGGSSVTATAAELNILDGATVVVGELNQFDADAADGASLNFADTQLSAAEVNALAATNIELVAAPAAGLAIVPIAVHCFLDHGGTDFVQTNNSDQLALVYSASNEIAEIGTEAQCTTFLEASADAALYSPIPAIAGGFVPEAATAIDLDNNGAAEYTTGDGTLSVRVYYRTALMAAFS